MLNEFVTKHVMFEYLNFYLNSQFYIKENFALLTDKMLRSYQKPDVLWNLFKNPQVAVSEVDREFTFVLKSVNK